MICVIRVRGRVNVRKDVEETLKRLRLRKKFSCVLLEENKVNLGMIKKVKDFVAFGRIDRETLKKLIEKRGQKIDKSKKINIESVVEELEKGKKLNELNLKPFFRLHPPRGGIKSKEHFPKGVLGDNKEKINDLVLRML
ncbi:MAG: 50S ribosomal protein L30 [Candidatus Pacearchaeota archaeon]|nr:MAG: 50S ribosomal protein L30 [Candidatus Pacearchaeota archaeon]